VVIDDADRLETVLSTVPGVTAVLPRVLSSGLLSTAVGSRPVQLVGVVPSLEVSLRDVSEGVVEGDRLDDSTLRSPLLVGRPVAEELEVGPGDRVVLTASGPDGEIVRALFHVAGVVSTGRAELDETMAFTTLEAARAALDMEGRLTQIGLLIDAGVEPDVVKAATLARLGDGWGDLEVLTWAEALPEMVGFIEIDNAFLYVYAVVVYLVVIFAIANTFLVSVMERVREFGLLNALGLRGKRIGQLVLVETTILTGFAMVMGLLLALAIHGALSRWGIPVGVWGIEDMELAGVDLSEMVMRSRIVPMKWFVASLIVAVATVASAIYPAWRAARLAPAEAMRFYE
jgi:ABC-type lipoprotein release transport system permease subunit